MTDCKKTRVAVLCAIWLLAGTGLAHAHQASLTHSRAQVSHDQRSVEYQIKFEPPDLAEALGLSADAEPTDEQVAAGQERLMEYVLTRLHVSDADRPCPIERTGPGLGAHVVEQGSRFIELRFRVRCPTPISILVVEYDLFFDLDSLHRGLLHVDYRDEKAVAELKSYENRFVWDLDEPPPDNRMAFVISGIEHIAFGYDHIAFLIGLLLIVTLLRVPGGNDGDAPTADAAAKGGWQLRPLVGGLRYTAVIVTSFTVAHSLTLIAASLGWISLSSRVVESMIAASIVYVAVENILRPDTRHRYVLTFVFGLMHGMGFASMLAVLLPPEDVIWPLLMFNVGVELGQLVIVALFLPLLHAFTRVLGARRYREWALPISSGLLGLFGLIWLIERVFDTVILGF